MDALSLAQRDLGWAFNPPACKVMNVCRSGRHICGHYKGNRRRILDGVAREDRAGKVTFNPPTTLHGRRHYLIFQMWKRRLQVPKSVNSPEVTHVTSR